MAQMRGGWKCALMDSGGQYVMMDGITLMHKLSVGSWDTAQ